MYTSHILVDRAYFIGIKQYGYTYKDQDGNKQDKSIWAGVTRDTIPFEIIESIAKGNTHKVLAENRFYRDLVNLNILIKDVEITLKDNKEKILLKNNYLPNSVTL